MGQSANGAWGYYLPDALGSIRQTTDDVGAVSGSREWTPFGVEVGAARGGLGYTGEWLDGSIDLQYLRARWYDVQVGRFTRKDPWLGSRSQPQTLHKYVYAKNDPINELDPSGFCSQSGWNDSSGLYTEENCDRLEAGDLEFTKQWYSDFADDVETELPQTAAHFRHFLSGQGGELQLPESFVKDDILGIGRLQRSIDKLSTWYVRKHISSLTPCTETPIGPDVYARGFTPNYAQVNPVVGFILGTNELDVSGALGGFRTDVELTGNLDRHEGWWTTKTDTNLAVHVVILDIYDWHEGLGVAWDGNGISDEWTQNLVDNSLAAIFLVRGDYTYDFNETLSKPLFGVSSSPPTPWYWASYIGSQLEITSYTGGPERVDYAGNPMKD
ncbi:MAG: RHS repeat-associated core domain-containing protein [Neptuniibacter sp.]|nr:RHS repeat-associated core domain-containing protein [Neptuniibacter sp.]